MAMKKHLQKARPIKFDPFAFDNAELTSHSCSRPATISASIYNTMSSNETHWSTLCSFCPVPSAGSAELLLSVFSIFSKSRPSLAALAVMAGRNALCYQDPQHEWIVLRKDPHQKEQPARLRAKLKITC